jgi:gluconokinase
MSSVLDEVVEGVEPSLETVSAMAAIKPAVVLGIDVGTSGVRAVLFDESGSEVPGARAQNSRDLLTRSGFAEIDAEAAVQLVVQTIDDLLVTANGVATHLELISISCFWHSLLGVDASGRAITPILTWADTRSVRATNELRARFDESEVHARTGCRFHPSYWPAKLWWLREECSRAFQDARLWLGFGEYLALRFCGQSAASVSMASATGLLNQRLCNWDRDLIRELNVSTDSLPEIVASTHNPCRLSEEFMVRWPKLSNARLYPAIGDGAANNIGSGCHVKKKAALMVGTSGALRVLYKGEPPDELPGALWCYRADRQRVVLGGALSDGGGLYRWLIDSLAFAADAESLQDSLARMEPDAHGLTILPFWAGERSTGWNANARGAILGLSMQTQTVDILRAAMEAVAYRFALTLQALEKIAPVTSLFASGNALRNSPLWAQIIADILNRPLSLSGTFEASSRGAALLALEAAGKIQSIEEFSIPVDRVFEPDAALHTRYREGLNRQQRLYELLISQERFW